METIILKKLQAIPSKTALKVCDTKVMTQR